MVAILGRRQGRSSERHPLLRTLRRVAVATAAVVAAPLLFVQPAEAARVTYGGLIGPYGTSQAACRSKLFGNQKVVEMTVAPPRALARNRVAGWGNDAAWVRYTVFVRNEATGAIVTPLRWSGWAWAKDNRVVTWSGVDSLSVPGYLVNYRIYYLIEWWSTKARTGYVIDQLQSYRLTDQTGIDRGTSNACTYLTGMYINLPY